MGKPAIHVVKPNSNNLLSVLKVMVSVIKLTVYMRGFSYDLMKGCFDLACIVSFGAK